MEARRRKEEEERRKQDEIDRKNAVSVVKFVKSVAPFCTCDPYAPYT